MVSTSWRGTLIVFLSLSLLAAWCVGSWEEEENDEFAEFEEEEFDFDLPADEDGR